MLDTHAVLWSFTRPASLPPDTRRAIEDRSNAILISAVSGYELAYKHRLGKLDQADRLLHALAEQAADAGFEQLDLSLKHALRAGQLDVVHRDPFDRLLIAQALVEDLTLVSNEALFDRYGVRRLW